MAPTRDLIQLEPLSADFLSPHLTLADQRPVAGTTENDPAIEHQTPSVVYHRFDPADGCNAALEAGRTAHRPRPTATRGTQRARAPHDAASLACSVRSRHVGRRVPAGRDGDVPRDGRLVSGARSSAPVVGDPGRLGITSPFAIQNLVLPDALAGIDLPPGRDVVSSDEGCAQVASRGAAHAARGDA